MGQKTNPNILRLGITKDWKTEFVEKKKKELPLYIFKDLEIQKYIERFLNSKGIFVYDYNQFYSNNTLNLYISCVVSYKFYKLHKITSVNLKKFKISKSYSLTKSRWLNNKTIRILNYFIYKKKSISSIKTMYNFKKCLQLKNFKYKIPKFVSNESCLVSLFKVLLQYTSNKFDIIINFSCVNKDFKGLTVLRKQQSNLLYKYSNVSFFTDDGFEILCYVVYNRNSARLLANFISFNLTIVKRPTFLLNCIRKTLKALLKIKKRFKFKGIKIIVKGRLKKSARTKRKRIILGNVPVQNIDSKIDYFQTTTHNSKGSYGIKIWIVW